MGWSRKSALTSAIFPRKSLRFNRPRELHLIDPWTAESGEYRQHMPEGVASDSPRKLPTVARFAAVRDRFASEIDGGGVLIHRANSEVVGASSPTVSSTGSISTAIIATGPCARTWSSIGASSSPAAISCATIIITRAFGTMASRARLTNLSRTAPHNPSSNGVPNLSCESSTKISLMRLCGERQRNKIVTGGFGNAFDFSRSPFVTNGRCAAIPHPH